MSKLSSFSQSFPLSSQILQLDVQHVHEASAQPSSGLEGLSFSNTAGKHYKLVEIFESVKGEGPQDGMPMLFVRFSKCNLACTWCDTPYNRVAVELSHAELLHVITTKRPAWVVFTGGEPCLQLDRSLTELLKAGGIKMAIETNGMIWTDALYDIDHVCISPKLGAPIHKKWLESSAPRPSEIRYTVCDGQKDIWHVHTGKVVDPVPITKFGWLERLPLNVDLTQEAIIGIATDWICMSPAFTDPKPNPNFASGMGFTSIYGEMDKASLNQCLHLVNKYKHLRSRLSVQTHKIIGAR
jgi:organic radical activating enzyme